MVKHPYRWAFFLPSYKVVIQVAISNWVSGEYFYKTRESGLQIPTSVIVNNLTGRR